MRKPDRVRHTHTALLLAAVVILVGLAGRAGPDARQSSPAQDEAGRSVTLLPDGRYLIVGGEMRPDAAALWNPRDGSLRPLQGLSTGRAWHTATVLADGSVLIFGGIGSDGSLLAAPERFDPWTQTFSAGMAGVSGARARHTATVLSDGRVLFVGGDVAVSTTSAEIWDPADEHSAPVGVPEIQPRRGHTARLLPDGNVLFTGGQALDGGTASMTEIFDSATGLFLEAGPGNALTGAGSDPVDGAERVPVDERLVLRFAEPLDVTSVSALTITLKGPEGPVALSLLALEGGRLILAKPATPLRPGSRYVLRAAGLRDAASRGQAQVVLARFTTATDAADAAGRVSDPEVWTPSADWRRGAIDSPWRRLPPLQGVTGGTSLAGQVLLLDGRPLAGVTLEIAGQSAKTDKTGRFLVPLDASADGWNQLVIDGRSANKGRVTFGRFEYGLKIVGGRTNVLPFTIWMPVLDRMNSVRIQSPTRDEVVITTPHIPGLELHLPAGTTITDEQGRTVREVSITPIPVDTPPFPMPHAQVPIYFTIQPGGATIEVAGGGYGRRGAWLVYPNYRSAPVGQRLPFWSYDPERYGWHIYGHGTVNASGDQVVPNSYTRLYKFTGAMMSSPGRNTPTNNPTNPATPGGDPVDLSTGLFLMQKTDLHLPDVLALTLTRTYRPEDTGARPFGIGTQPSYDLWLDNSTGFMEVYLILADGSQIHYVRTSPGTGSSGAEFAHTSTSSDFYGSRIVNVASGWELTLRDGTTFFFPPAAPLKWVRDRFGNTITITREGDDFGRIAKITSPNGRYIEFTYDGSDRIIEATDSIGRTVEYEYDGGGRLWKVTDANGGVTEYTYDGAHRMLTIEDPRGIVYLTNDYDIAGRVIEQTQADAGTFQFDYTVNGSGKVTQTDLTDPRGFVRRVTFDASGYPLTDTRALGEAEEQTITYTRLSGSGLPETITDPLGRVTHFQYDSRGNVTQQTRLYGTLDAEVTSWTYDSTLGLVTSVTDPLNRTTTFAYDAQGRLLSQTDPLNRQTLFTSNPAGQILSVTDPLDRTTSFVYDVGDLVQVVSPLSHTSSRFLDTAGRVIRMTDPLGASTTLTYNALDQVTAVTDPHGGQTSFTYDSNGNLLTLTDARSKTTTWTYDNMDRVATRTDPLSGSESFSYDLHGNLTSWTDRKGQVTTYQYDPLDRQVFVGFDTTAGPTYASTITTIYDDGDRATEVVDSIAGTIERTYDLLDRLTEEVTPEGTVGYTYDAVGRRTAMTVTGQSSVSYTYDTVDRLTEIEQGAAIVTLAYDAADRRTSLTLPNGIVVEYGYDDDSRLTGLTYKDGTTPLGDLTYTYDAAGQRTSVGGSYARSGLPAALASATYDDANQITAFGGVSFSYDDNGNLTSDGSRSYTWDARNQLTGISGSVSASFGYDGFGRRRSRTVGSATTGFLYDGLNPVQELVSGTPAVNFLTGLGIDEFLTRTDGSGTSMYLTDALGSTVALADGSAAVQTEYTYEPFGGTTVNGSSSDNAFGFTGREADGTGLYFYRARYYDPRLQRFISEDPEGFDGGDVNLHRYVLNAPLDFTDPLGRFVMRAPNRPWCDPGNPASRKYALPLLRPLLSPLVGDICDPTNLPMLPAMAFKPRFGPKGARPGNIGPRPGSPRRPSDAPDWKPTDALREHNRQARNAARAAGLNRDQQQQLHSAISKEQYTYQEILKIARAIKNGTWW